MLLSVGYYIKLQSGPGDAFVNWLLGLTEIACRLPYNPILYRPPYIAFSPT